MPILIIYTLYESSVENVFKTNDLSHRPGCLTNMYLLLSLLVIAAVLIETIFIIAFKTNFSGK